MDRGITWEAWAVLVAVILLAVVICIAYYVSPAAMLIALVGTGIIGGTCAWAVQSSRRGGRRYH